MNKIINVALNALIAASSRPTGVRAPNQTSKLKHNAADSIV